jgi:hypothetical protein
MHPRPGKVARPAAIRRDAGLNPPEAGATKSISSRRQNFHPQVARFFRASIR